MLLELVCIEKGAAIENENKQEGYEALNYSPESKPLWEWSNQAKDPAVFTYFKLPGQPNSQK